MGNADISRAALAPCQQGCHGVHELLAIATVFMACLLSGVLLCIVRYGFLVRGFRKAFDAFEPLVSMLF